jgi:hypothetical protein
MTLRFHTDYRSRAWNTRFAAGDVVEVFQPLADECLAAGVATDATPSPEPVPEPVKAPEPVVVPEPAKVSVPKVSRVARLLGGRK